MQRLLGDIVSTELVPGMTLAAINPKRRINELEFLFPAPSLEFPALRALLAAHGYGALARMNRVGDKAMRFVNRRAPRFALASTAALEHLTALLARRILEDDSRFTTSMDRRMGALWRWHAFEEAEHKAVAFDVLKRVAPSYPLRALALFWNTVGLFVEMLVRTAYMLWKDGELGRGLTWREGWAFLFGREGLLRGMGPDYRAWYRRDFHPSQIDDRALLAAWRERICASTAGALPGSRESTRDPA